MTLGSFFAYSPETLTYLFKYHSVPCLLRPQAPTVAKKRQCQ